jgi:hypothetical protein
VPGSTFTVQIRGDGAAWWDPVAAATAFQVTGGKVTSIPAGIDCGIVDGIRTTSCTADFAWSPSASVALVATMSTGSSYVAFAGGCGGSGPCALTGNSDKMVMVRFSAMALGHSNWSDWRVHEEKFSLFVNGLPGALDCTFCHGANLQGQGIALACNGCHSMPEKNAAPTVTADASEALTGSPVQVTIAAKDPNTGDTIACSAELASQPAGATATLTGGAGTDCREADKTVSFTPDLDGLYVVRVTVTDGTAIVTRDVTVGASAYTGGAVLATTTPAVNATMTRLLADIAMIPSYGTSVPAANVYRAFAAISPTAPPTNGSASTQGPVLGWESRPYDVIDVRDPANFAAGHVPGAVNVPLQHLPGVLLAMPWFPSATQAGAKPALVAGYTQGDSSLGAIVVTVGRVASGQPLGANTVSYLNHGMAAWTYDKAAVPFRWDDDLGTYRFGFTLADTSYLERSSDTANFSFAGKPEYGHPEFSDFTGELAITNTTLVPAMKRILVRVRDWAKWAREDTLARGMSPAEAFVTNWGLYKRLRDASEPYHVLTRQSDAEWRTARAVNAYRGDLIVSNAGVVTQANFKYLDPAAPVLVNCFSNVSAVRPCFVLSVLGYKSRSVLYGISGLLSPTITGAGFTGGAGAGLVAAVQDNGANGNDFPLSKSASDPQDLAWTQPAAAGCRACHTDYGAQYTIAAKLPSAPAPAVQSEGEG